MLCVMERGGPKFEIEGKFYEESCGELFFFCGVLKSYLLQEVQRGFPM